VVAQLLGTGAQPAHDDLDVIRVCLGDEQVFELLDVGGRCGEIWIPPSNRLLSLLTDGAS
jgi:hypothetical protein